MFGVNDREGRWFAVPLRGRGGYALGIVARASRSSILAGYFFGPRHDSLPTLADVEDQLRTEVMPKGSPTTPKDGMMGAGFVESVLTRKLSP